MSSQQYWVKTSADGAPQGPYSGADLRQLASNGQLDRQWLISLDHATWYLAGQIGGLWPTAQPVAAEPVGEQINPFATAAPPMAQVAQYASPPPPAASMNYYSPSPYGSPYGPEVHQPRPRSATGFFIASVFLLPAGVFVDYIAYDTCTVPSGYRFYQELSLTAILCFLIFTAAAAPVLVMWLKWVQTAHKDLKYFANGNYEPTPGTAVGLCFVPLFNIYWEVFMPCKLGADVNQHLAARGLQPVSIGTVRLCQILSIFLAFPVPGAAAILYGISMAQVQGGLNRLLAAPAHAAR